MKTAGYEIEPYPADPEQDAKEVREIQRERRRKIRERLVTYCKRGIGATAIGLSLVTGHLLDDIHDGKEAVADSHPSIHFIYEGENPDYDDVATVVATGLGTRNPTETAKKLTSHRQIGDVYALEYSNKDINIDELTQTVVDMANENGIKTLVFDGYSMGGPIELAIAANIYKNEPDLQVSDIILNSSPIGDQGISSQSQAAADKLSFFINIYPDVVYSKDLRFIVEMAARDRMYWQPPFDFDYDEFKKQIKSVYHDKIENEEAASGALIAAQFQFWERFGVDDNLKVLSQDIDGKYRPRIYYTRARNPADDTVVNIDRSRDNLQALARKYDMESKVLYIDNIGHANPGERPSEYNQAFTNDILPDINADILAERKPTVTIIIPPNETDETIDDSAQAPTSSPPSVTNTPSAPVG